MYPFLNFAIFTAHLLYILEQITHICSSLEKIQFYWPLIFLAISITLFLQHSEYTQMNRRNFTVRTTKTRQKQLTYSTIRPKTHFRLTKTSQEASKIAAKVNEVWIMVGSAGIEISRETVLRYLDRKMKEKLFRYRDILMETLKNGELPKTDKKMEDFSETILQFQVEQMLSELQILLEKRVHKDIEVLKDQIKQADSNIQQAIDVEYYQRLVCSFRPSLITNSSDLAKQYESLSGQGGERASRSCRIQQNRYWQLGRLEGSVADMHNKVYLQKSDSKLIDFYHALGCLVSGSCIV